MGCYADYLGKIVICKEIRASDYAQYWETEDGKFGVWLMGIDRPKNAKVKDRGLLHYNAKNPAHGLFSITPWNVGGMI